MRILLPEAFLKISMRQQESKSDGADELGAADVGDLFVTAFDNVVKKISWFAYTVLYPILQYPSI